MVPDIVATLPMSPSHADKLGFYSLLVYAHRFATAEGMATVYAVNRVGKPDGADTVSRLCQAVEMLDITPTIWWDDASVTESAFAKRMGRLYADGFISTNLCEVKRCACGKVEHIDSPLFGKKKTLIKDGHATCCDTVVTVRKDSVLVTTPLPHVMTPLTTPQWAHRELDTVLAELAGRRLLVSRETPRIFAFRDEHGRTWHVDTDLLWWLYLAWLSSSDAIPRQLVVGHSIIRQTGIVLAVSSTLGLPIPERIHCLPKVLFQPGNGVQTLKQAVSRFGPTRVTNALAWASMSGMKQYVLSSSLFTDMKNSVPSVFSRHKLRL